MGTKFSSIAISGYNSSPPSDDGATNADNQLQWAKHLSKIGNPIKTAVESINTALVTALDQSARSTSSTTTAVSTDHNRIIEIAAAVSTGITISLSDAATMADGYIANVHNLSAVQHTLARVTAGDFINGVASDVPIAPYSMIKAWVNAAENGYLVSQASGVRNSLTSAITISTEQASTSGTSIDFTGIPSGVRRITVMFVGVSTNGGSGLFLRLGDSGGLETSGYAGATTSITEGVGTGTVANTAAFAMVTATNATDVFHGSVVLTLENNSNNTWVAAISTSRSDAASANFGSGTKSLSGILDRVSVFAGGANTFDAGVINISYE